jgi:hypothetical protein
MKTRCGVAVVFGAAALARVAAAQSQLPSEFEQAGTQLAPLFSYFGGVNGFGGWVSAATIHTGNSMYVYANFQHDNFFRIAGFAVGDLDIAPPQLAVPAGANTFSVTVQGPTQTAAQLAMIVSFREDDNNDGVIDPGNGDDEWESAPVMLEPGVRVYNIPVASFIDTDAGNGNGARNVTTATRMGLVLTFESRATFAGGIIETPISLRIDHAGFYAGPQSLPPRCGSADFNGDGDVGTDADIEAFFACLAGSCCTGCGSADFNADGDTGTDADIEAFFRVLGGGSC